MNKLNNRQPLVSVIMPVYNAGEFLVEAINSVLNQTYPHFEILTVNDGSTDNSLEILRRLAKRDKRVKVYSQKKNMGLSFAANLGIQKSKGTFLARFDADDIMPEDRLEKQVEYLLENPDIVVVGGQCEMIDENGKFIGIKKFPIHDHEIRKMIFFAMSLQAGSMMINRKFIPKAFKFYTSKYRYAEDHELLFKLLQFGTVMNLPNILLYYRQHKNNSTKKIDHKQIFKEIYNIRMTWFRKNMTYGLEVLLVNWLQYIVVILLPEDMILSVFAIARGMKNIRVPIIKLSSLNKMFPKVYAAFRTYLF